MADISRPPGIRRAAIPIEHLDCEILAAPFGSPAAFQCALTRLPDMRDPGAGSLWRAAEKELAPRFPGTSLDELVVRRDRAWFPQPSNSSANSLLDILGAAGKVIGSITLAGDLRRSRRWLSFSMPFDLIEAADGFPRRAATVSPTLEKMLSGHGFAESHLHLKAAMDFRTLWAALQRTLARSDARAEMFASPGAEFDEGRMLGPWLIRCALARLVLAGFLARGGGGLADYIRGSAVPGIEACLGALRAASVHRGIRELALGRLVDASPSFSILAAAYATLVGGSKPAASGAADPLSFWFGGHDPERGLLTAAYAYLASPAGKTDTAFQRLFWQAQRMRVILYRHVVQRPMTTGMQWFTRTYARLSAPRKSLGVAAFVEGALALSGPGLRSLEARIAPDDNMAGLIREVRAVDEAARRHPAVEVGLGIHFCKTRGPSAEKGRPEPWGSETQEDPGSRKINPAGYRFSGFYLRRRREAMAVSNMLLTFPRILERVRAVDVCTDELAVPLWAVIPLIEHVRKAAARARCLLADRADPPGPLRITVHAGEDWVHLLGGIRHVSEVVTFLDYGDGDRIGHGVALGVNVREWTETVREMLVPKGERMFDLVWAWYTCMTGAAELRPWVPWLGHEAVRLGRDLFNSPDLSVENLVELWLRLHRPAALAEIGFPIGPPLPPERRSSGFPRLADLWLRDRAVFRRSQEVQQVRLEGESELIEKLQSEVRRQLTVRGVVIEVNPSSNLLIAHLGDLTNHPLWRLAPPAPGTHSDGVRVCIGSDDPITFATRLPEEYQLLHDALIEGGLSATEADQWLDRVRETGLVSRFTQKRSRHTLTSAVGFERLPVIP